MDRARSGRLLREMLAFDILAMDGDDLRDLPLSMRKTNLQRLLTRGLRAYSYQTISKGRLARTSSGRPASSVLRTWCRSDRIVPILAAGVHIGSRLRTEPIRPWDGYRRSSRPPHIQPLMTIRTAPLHGSTCSRTIKYLADLGKERRANVGKAPKLGIRCLPYVPRSHQTGLDKRVSHARWQLNRGNGSFVGKAPRCGALLTDDQDNSASAATNRR